MGEYPHGYEPTAQVFLALDRDRLVRELDPAGSGQKDGAEGQLPAEHVLPTETEQRIRARIEVERKQALDIFADRVRSIDERLTRLDISGRAFEITTSAGDAVSDFRALANSGRGAMAAPRLRLERHRDELAAFCRRHRLERPARTDHSRILAWGVLAVIGLVEMAFNNVFFSIGNDLGILGAGLEAFAVTFLNLGVAFTLGRLALPELVHRNYGRKLAGLTVLLPGLGFPGALNLFVAHYRDLLGGLAPDEAGPSGVARLPRRPARLERLPVVDPGRGWPLLGLHRAHGRSALRRSVPRLRRGRAAP